MSDEDSITRNDIPQVEELKAAILTELGSGRVRSCEVVLKDVSSSLSLSAKQRGYKIKGSKTTLLENRYEKARSETCSHRGKRGGRVRGCCSTERRRHPARRSGHR